MSDKTSPHMAVETFLSLCKWFLLIFIVINLIWAAVFTIYVKQSFNGTTYDVTQEQSGYDNVQGVNNVSKTNG